MKNKKKVKRIRIGEHVLAVSEPNCEVSQWSPAGRGDGRSNMRGVQLIYRRAIK